MEYPVFLLAFVWCGFGLVADITDGISIENCGSGSIDIRENAENSITCKDFDANANVTWYIGRSNTSTLVSIATCTPSTCTLHHQTGQFTVQRSLQESQLVYRQQNRTEDLRARIMCEKKVWTGSSAWNTLQAACDFNLISPAILSGCVVEEDRDNRTVNGSCRFERAFISAKRGFACTWQQTTSSGQPTVHHSGNVNKEKYTSTGQEYWRGQCWLFIRGQQWNDGDYNYSVDFYPGSGRQSVPIKGSASAVPPSTSTPVSSQSTSTATGTTEGSSRPSVTSSSPVTSSPPGPSQSTASTTGTPEGLSNDPDTDDDSLPIAAIAGGAVAAVVVIIVVVVVIVVVVTRRRQRRKSAETPQASRENEWNGRRSHLRDNSPTTVTPMGDNTPTTESSLSPAGDISSSTESSLSPAGDNSPTTVNSPPETEDNSPANNYESLRTSDMGLRSVYSALAGPDYYNTGFAAGGTGATTASHVVNNPPQTGDNLPANNYESLRTSDMGLRSVYSALAGPDYYNTGFAAGGTGPGGEASPIYEN